MDVALSRAPELAGTEKGDESPSSPMPDPLDEDTPRLGEPASARLLEPGTKVGRYTLLALLGRGGMGAVYKAYDAQLDRNIALKLLLGLSNRQNVLSEEAARLLREAKTLASLSHPNIVTVFDAGLDSHGVFVAMELCEGVDLSRWLEHPHPPAEVIELFCRAGQGLAAAHAKGYVHRDFKPANVMVGPEGSVRVLDFGLAHLASRRRREARSTPTDVDEFTTSADIILGTPAFMAPEQWNGEDVDARTDQFSFCLALFWALYGHSPFDASSTEEKERRTLQGEVTFHPRDGKVSRRLPARVRKALLRGLEPRSEDRFPSMEALLTELRPRARRRLASALGFVALSSSIGAWAAWPESTTERCARQARERTSALFSEGTRSDVRASVLRYSAPQDHLFMRFERHVDAYVERWRQASEENCVATFVALKSAPAKFERVSQCLDGTGEFLEAALQALIDAKSEAQFHARLNVTYQLRPIEECRDTESARYSLPVDPLLRQRVSKLYESLNRLPITAADDVAEATTQARDLLVRAREIGFEPLTAGALGQLGKLLIFSGEYEQSVEVLSDTIRIASQSGEAYVEAEAWTDLIGSYRSLGNHDRALSIVLATESAVHRSHSELLRTWMLNNIGGVYASQGDHERAADYIERALDAKRELLGEDHPDVAISTANLARVLMDRADYEHAQPYVERSYEILGTSLGPNHPKTRIAMLMMIRLAFRRGHDEQAIALGRSFLTARSAVHDDPTIRASVELILGRALARQGNHSEARQAARRALELISPTSNARLKSDIVAFLDEVENNAP